MYNILVPANEWTWGQYKYRYFGNGNYDEAVVKCQDNGGTLPVPLSGKLRINLHILGTFDHTCLNLSKRE